MLNDSYISHSKFRGVANRVLTVVGLVLLVVLGARAQSQLTDPNMVQGKPRITIASANTVSAADLLSVVPVNASPIAVLRYEQKSSSTASQTSSSATKAGKSSSDHAADKEVIPDNSSANKKQPQTMTASTAATKTVERAKRP